MVKYLWADRKMLMNKMILVHALVFSDQSKLYSLAFTCIQKEARSKIFEIYVINPLIASAALI